MTDANVEILRDAYEALNRGDVEAALAVLEPGAEWCEHSELPEADTYRGRGAIRRFLGDFLESWEEFHQETERLIDAGDTLGVFLHSRAKGKGSGVEVEGRYAHVWTMREGKGVRVVAYADPQVALDTLERVSTVKRL